MYSCSAVSLVKLYMSEHTLHTHPGLETKLNLPICHVIIDVVARREALQYIAALESQVKQLKERTRDGYRLS